MYLCYYDPSAPMSLWSIFDHLFRRGGTAYTVPHCRVAKRAIVAWRFALPFPFQRPNPFNRCGRRKRKASLRRSFRFLSVFAQVIDIRYVILYVLSSARSGCQTVVESNFLLTRLEPDFLDWIVSYRLGHYGLYYYLLLSMFNPKFRQMPSLSFV